MRTYVRKMRGTARQASEIHAVLSLLATGASDYEIARRTGIPRSTVLNWRHGKIPGNPDSDGGRCDRCGGREHPPDELPVAPYAYLLGQYLGDGCLFRVGKAGFALRISSDSAYPGIIRECCQAIEAVRGRRPYVDRYPDKRLSTITSYWRVVAVPVSSTRTRQEAEPHDRALPLAGSDCRGRPRPVRSRSHPFGRVARAKPRPCQRAPLRVPPVSVLESVQRHSPAVHLRLRAAWGGLASLGSVPRLGRTP